MSEPEFDDIHAKVMESLESGGNPEGISEEVARATLAGAFKVHAGKDFEDVFTEPLNQPEPDRPVGQQRVIHVPQVPTEPYWYEDPDQAAFIEHHILTRRALGSFMSGGLLITGPSGSGKTMGVPQLIDRMNRERGLGLTLLQMDCSTVTDPQKWFGRREIDKAGTRYEKSDFINAVESGAVILLDEVKRLHPTIHNPIMSLLAGTESVLLSDLNVTITRHPETVFLATTNEGAAFGGNHRMDYAMDERWPFRVERGFPEDPLEEIKIITSRAPGCSDADADRMVKIAHATRAQFHSGDLRAPISTRTLVHAGLLVASGYTVKEALLYTAVMLYDDNADGSATGGSERERVMQAIDGKVKR